MVTKPVGRNVNPIFNATLIVEDLAIHDRLRFVVRDIGLLQEVHAGGFGPRNVASGSVPAEEDFKGWLELTPEAHVPDNNGGPLMLLEVRIREASAWPGESTVADRVGVFEGVVGGESGCGSVGGGESSGGGVSCGGGISEQALRGGGFMPAPPCAPPSMEPEPEEYRSCGVPGSFAPAEKPATDSGQAQPAPQPATDSGQAQPAPATGSGQAQPAMDSDPIPASWGEVPPPRPNFNISPFSISDETWTFYKKGQLEDCLLRMSAMVCIGCRGKCAALVELSCRGKLVAVAQRAWQFCSVVVSSNSSTSTRYSY